MSSNNTTRIKWTSDLHKQFVDCVNRLGGPKKATPKGILKLMDNIDGLTIFQIKSHLQKYRIAKDIQDASEEEKEKGKSKMKTQSDLDSVTSISQKRMRIAEALGLQLEVQRHLHQQLEIQRDLQLRIEEQGKKLKLMLDQQLNTNQNRD